MNPEQAFLDALVSGRLPAWAITVALAWWLLARIVGIFAADDADEATGYKNAAADARKPGKARAPVGLAAMLDAIRDASTDAALSRAVQVARAAHASGESSVAVERVIVDWFVVGLEDPRLTLDGLTSLRDLANTVKPRGGEALRSAFASAGRRVEPQ